MTMTNLTKRINFLFQTLFSRGRQKHSRRVVIPGDTIDNIETLPNKIDEAVSDGFYCIRTEPGSPNITGFKSKD